MSEFIPLPKHECVDRETGEIYTIISESPFTYVIRDCDGTGAPRKVAKKTVYNHIQYEKYCKER